MAGRAAGPARRESAVGCRPRLAGSVSMAWSIQTDNAQAATIVLGSLCSRWLSRIHNEH